MSNGILPPLFRRALLGMLVFAATVQFAPVAAPAAETTFTFKGGGWGHGIGMSQYGARGYALQGKDYKWILAHYYQGTKIVTKSSVVSSVNLDSSSHSRTAWHIGSGSGSALKIIQLSDSASSLTLSSTEDYWITVSSGNTRVHEDSSGAPGKVLKTFSGTCYAKAGSSLSSSIVRMYSPSGPFGHRSVHWRGYIRFVPDGTSKSKAVNRVRIEDYLRGVVPRESPSSWPAEALKAQAVAARSYAYQDAKDGRTIWCTTMSQVYNGMGGEASTTDAAIAATAGELVWYGNATKPVQTFFFSSSGGHTANIEDVWTAAAPQPYYTGVPDADKDGNPYYTWSVGPLTTSYISPKVRARVGSSYSSPSPHTITGMSIKSGDQAASGFTRYVTVQWSDGKSYRIKGDTLRSVLGLRSSKFSISGSTPTPQWSYYSEKSSLLGWSGFWSSTSRSSATARTYRQTSMIGSRCVIRFEGTGVRWIGYKGPKYGKVQVELDGKVIAVVDQYASKEASKRRLFTKNGLKPGEHTLVLKVLKSRNSNSAGRTTSVDRVDVEGGRLLQAAAPVTVYRESHGKVAKLGGWQPTAGADYLGGQQIVNQTRNAKVLLDFHGTGVRWRGSKGPDYGKATVYIDGGAAKTIALTAADPSDKNLLFEASGLAPNTRHRILIKVLGPSSGGAGRVSVDQLEVVGGWAYLPKLAVKRFQESSSLILKTSRWRTTRKSGPSKGSHIVTRSKGSEVTVRFEGSSISWIGARSPRSGRAAVYLDGVRVATVDQYGSSVRYRQKLFSKSRLSAGPHELKIRVLGSKRSSSGGTYINVDAFDVAGRLAR